MLSLPPNEVESLPLRERVPQTPGTRILGESRRFPPTSAENPRAAIFPSAVAPGPSALPRSQSRPVSQGALPGTPSRGLPHSSAATSPWRTRCLQSCRRARFRPLTSTRARGPRRRKPSSVFTTRLVPVWRAVAAVGLAGSRDLDTHALTSNVSILFYFSSGFFFFNNDIKLKEVNLVFKARKALRKEPKRSFFT